MKVKNPKGKDIYIGLLSLIAFTIPLLMVLNNIALIALLFYWLVLCFQRRLITPQVKYILILTIPYFLIIVGSIYSENLHQLNMELTKGLPFLILPLIIFTLPFKISENQLKPILKSFIIGNSLICLFLLMVILKTLLSETFSAPTLWLLTHQTLSAHVELNAIYLALYISLCLTILIYYFLKNNKKIAIKRKFMYAIVALLFSIILIFLSSRTVLFSCAVVNSTLFLFFDLKRHKPMVVLGRFVFLIVILSIGVFAANPILRWRVESMFDMQDNTISSDGEQGIEMRDKLWSSSLQVFKENWIIGVGTGDYKVELEKLYRSQNFRIQFRHHMNSHNQYLSYGVSNGLLGLIMFVFYLGFCIVTFYRGNYSLSVFLAFTFVLCFMTESHLYTNKGIIVVAFLLTLLSKNALDNEEIQSNEKA